MKDILMREAILTLKEQLQYRPVVINKRKLPKRTRVAFCGMGGSHLAGNILARLSEKEVWVWHDYGLPLIVTKDATAAKHWLVVASSYSGNTEEVLNSYRAARAKKIPVAVIAKGGKLLSWAKRDKVPYVMLPDMHFEPRMGVGLSFCAAAALCDEKEILRNTYAAGRVFSPKKYEKQGKRLALALRKKIPVIYSSTFHDALARIWKIAMNETTKVPAFWNVIPEMNHNEMTGFDCAPKAKKISADFAAIIMFSAKDDLVIRKRMRVLEIMYKKRGIHSYLVELESEKSEKHLLISWFGAIALGYFTALSLARYYRVEPMAVPMVEEFKRRITKSQ